MLASSNGARVTSGGRSRHQRGGRSHALKERSETRLHACIAFTCRGLETWTIEDRHTTVRIANEALSLKLSRGGGDTRFVHAQHEREEPPCEWKGVRPGAVVGHEDPARAPLDGGVSAVARHGLYGLIQQGLRKAQSHEAE